MSSESAITVETEGVEHAVLDLLSISERAGDIRPQTEKVRDVYLRSNERHFGKGWAPLADATSERKSRQGLDSQAEVASGALRKALTQKRAKGQKTRRKRDELRFGVGLFYASWQQGTKTQPARDMIDLSPSDLRQINDLVEHYIARGHE